MSYTGEIIIGPSVKVGYVPQIINFKNDNQLLLDYFKEEANISEQKARSVLAGFGFYSEDMSKRVGKLSGGERIRLRFAVLLQQQVNTLIFDEPTNHIDIPTKETLEDAIVDFEGTLLFVSHDRFFINKFAKKIVEFKDGTAFIYTGNYDDYRNEKK